MSYYTIQDDKRFGIEAKIIKNVELEYTALNDKVIPGKEDRPMIIENMIHQKNVTIDVMEGFDPIVASVINQHSIFHLYEYESITRFLDRIPRPLFGNFDEIKTRFLCCRYVICAIDDWMTKHKYAELMAIRKNGDIYIGSNKSIERYHYQNSEEAAFGGLNFAKKVTEEKNPTNFRKHHSVVRQWRIEHSKNQTAMTVFISSVARAFDEHGDVVELKTVGSNVMGKLQNLPGAKARNWWLRALLSGANRIVYGLRMKDMTVNEIHEALITDFTHGHFQFNSSRLFSEVFKLFGKIDKTLVEDGSMCLVVLKNYEQSVKLTTSESLKRSPFW